MNNPNSDILLNTAAANYPTPPARLAEAEAEELTLRLAAAAALDATHAHEHRGPRTSEARRRLGAWLDGSVRLDSAVRADTRWLMTVAALYR